VMIAGGAGAWVRRGRRVPVADAIEAVD